MAMNVGIVSMATKELEVLIACKHIIVMKPSESDNTLIIIVFHGKESSLNASNSKLLEEI